MSQPPKSAPYSGTTLWVAAALCAAVPWTARSLLNDRVQGQLSQRASDYLGVDVELGRASVGLTGTLEIEDLRVAQEFEADRLVAAVAPTTVTSAAPCWRRRGRPPEHRR